MADDSQEDRSSEDLSDEASPYRIQEYREKGMVAQSKELSGIAVFIAVAASTWILAPKMASDTMALMKEVFQVDLILAINLQSQTELSRIMYRGLQSFMILVIPVSIIGFIVGVVASFAQVGSIFSTTPIEPDLERINPLKGAQKFMNLRMLLEGLRVIFKSFTAFVIVYLLMKSEVLKSASYNMISERGVIGYYGKIAFSITSALTLLFVLFAVIDFIIQRWEFSKKLRLTKKEAKEEHREREGDPQIKARIRAVQREVSRRRMMQAVKTADVIVTNPTHIAIAISYEKDKMSAPKVVAKGADLLAQKIKKVASEAGIPLVENVPLARTLYKSVKVGQFVPRALYQAVAEVLAYVYRLRNRHL